ncbi:cytochrome c oxidase accessory protein CcoG [Novispirillum sp. DQ9]|uniref:cytochrome c oxidase accessory protein CcoG n=1 Tax=Novispirillum sp. DQ9 TaxID=3398612 RepID=UPI003C7D6760
MAVAEKVAKTGGGASPAGGGKKPEQPSSSLYEDYKKVQPKRVSGYFRTLKNWAAIILLGIYFIGPWLRWDRGPGAPDQAILLDMSGRRGYILGVEFWPQEIYYLTGLLILGAVGLFFVTALLGRVWCGFTCIQTVFTDVFVMVERVFQGDRNERIKRDRGPMTVDKVWRKGITNAVWILLSLATGWTWVIYFNDAPATTMALFQGEFTWGVMGFALMVAGFTYLLAGFAREQVCIYMCPWPRFQGAMFDEDTLVVTYEKWRGEPRGFAKKSESFETRGHCVDCQLCVQVCPTGIDIRNGSQLACIGCGLCIDACNTVMDRFNLPRDLITYDSVANQVARAKKTPTQYRLARGRTIAYAGIMVVVAAVMAFGLITRARVDVSVLHERSPLFVTLADGGIRNGYTFKILNMLPQEQTYRVSVQGVEGATMTVVGFQEEPVATTDLTVRPDSVGTFRVYVSAPRAAVTDKAMDLEFAIENLTTGETAERDTLFAGPGS